MKRTFTKHTLISALMFLLFFGISFSAQAQDKPKVYEGAEAAKQVPKARYVRESKSSPFPARVKFKEGASIPKQNFLTWYRTTFKVDPSIALKPLRSSEDDLGNTHQRYVQTYQGIPVDMSWLIVHSKGGKVYSFNGYIDDVSAANTTPGLTEDQALGMAKKIIGSKKYLWEDAREEEMLKELLNDPNATSFPTGELVLVKEDGGDKESNANYVLAWKFDIREVGSALDQRIYIHATSGKKIKSIPLVMDCDPGSATTTWNGNQTIQTDWDGSSYILKDDCPGHATIHTVKEAGLVEYKNWDNTWDSIGQTGPATTHYHGRRTIDYFQAVHGRNSYDNAGGGILLRHRANYSNAFYSGSGKMTFGARTADSEYYNTLDVVAHEFTHGVVNSEANLVYQGESGALNESFADILGETCERWNENNMNIDWLHREDYYNGNNRSFSNPNDKNHPDTYLGTNWRNTCGGCADAGGVHSNSGVQNFWFYVLTVGKNGTNDNGDNYAVSGIGLVKARTIAYDNLTNQLGENSDYDDARDGAIAAAEERYGICSNEVLQVKNAWYAVGVGANGAAINGLEGVSILFSPEYCQDDPGPVVGINTSSTKYEYQLKDNGGSNLGAPVPGTGSPIYFGSFPNGTYKVGVTEAGCNGEIQATSSSTKGECSVAIPDFCGSCGDGVRTPVTIKTTAPVGQNWKIKERIGLYGPANALPQIPVNTALNYIGGGMYQVSANKLTNKGFWVKVTNGFTDLDIMLGNPSW